MMGRGRWGVVLLLAVVCRGVAADDLPARSVEELLGVSDSLLLYENSAVPEGGAAMEAEVDVARMEGELERARKSAASGLRLVKAGILAKVEAERRELRVVRLTRELEVARARARERAIEGLREEAKGKGFSPEELCVAEVELGECRARVEEASAAWQKAELAAAELNLERQRKLLKAGIGRKYLVERAEARVAALKGGGGPAVSKPSK